MSKGKEFELLVAHLEQLLSDSDIVITHDDQIPDTRSKSGKTRQIDISLRIKAGSHEVLIIIECRNRQKVDDVTWIDSLATKKRAVGADKAVAVSASGFSDLAKDAAEAENIVLRTVEQITLGEISSWFGFSEIEMIIYKMEILPATAMYCVGVDKTDKVLVDKLTKYVRQVVNSPRDTKLFLSKTKEHISLHKLFVLLKHVDPQVSNDIDNDMIKYGNPFTFEARIHINPDNPMLIPEIENVQVKFIDFRVSIEKLTEKIGVDRIMQYQENDKTLVQSVRFSGNIGNDTYKIDITRPFEKPLREDIPFIFDMRVNDKDASQTHITRLRLVNKTDEAN